MASSRNCRFLLCFLCIPVWSVAAGSFLQREGESGLFLDLEGVFGHGSFENRLEKLEAHVKPMFLSLPQTPNGLLGHAATRYALHRVVLELHGWSITGLEATATTFNVTSLVGSGIMSGLFPKHVEAIFERHIQAEGFSLRDLVITAGAIEHLVQEDQKVILRNACAALNLPTLGPMSEENMTTIIQLYMTVFLRTLDADVITPLSVSAILDDIGYYVGWEDSKKLLADERQTLEHVERDRTNPFKGLIPSLQVAQRVVERVADHFTRDQGEPECQEMKEDLLAYERGNGGRVSLPDFYRAGLSSRFYFVESKDFLRDTGALDESDARWPQVIVPNYILSKGNCMASSHIYAACCINECTGLMSHLEHEIAAPEATPERILAAAAGMSSSTVQAPRNLSVTLSRHLNEISLAHSGSVLLHGRRFAQWMHFAFPRECPYPHAAGTTTTLGSEDWVKRTGKNYRIDAEVSREFWNSNTLSHIQELERHASETQHETQLENDAENWTWSIEEEHFAEPTRPLFARLRTSPVIVSRFILVAVVAAVWLVAGRLLPKDCGGAKAEMHFV